MSRQCTQELFLKDVAAHRMKILHSDGLHRHLVFRGRSFNQWFEIITWPGKLTISGDMGTWVFARIEDMFAFFRGDGINPGYWSEKLESRDRTTDDREFSMEAFREDVLGRLNGYSLSKSRRAKVITELEGSVFCSENPYEAYDSLARFNAHGVNFDSDYPSGKRYSFCFIWCLWAIVWGIEQFDRGQAR